MRGRSWDAKHVEGSGVKPADLEAVALLVLLEDVAAQAPDMPEGNVRAIDREIRQTPYREGPYHSRGSQQTIADSPGATRRPIHDATQPLTEGNLPRESLPLGSHEDVIDRVAHDISDDASPASSGYGGVGIAQEMSNALVDSGVKSKSADSTEEIFSPGGRQEGNMTPFLLKLVAADGEVLSPAMEAQDHGSPGDTRSFEGATAPRNEPEIQASELTGKDTSRVAESAGVLDGLPKSSRGDDRARRRKVMRQKREQLELGRRVAALEEMAQESSKERLARYEQMYPRLSYPA